LIAGEAAYAGCVLERLQVPIGIARQKSEFFIVILLCGAIQVLLPV